MKRRFGNFFLTIGVTLLILFFISDIMEIPNAMYLVAGALLAGCGAYLAVSGRAPSEPSGRFRTVKKLMTKKEKPEKKGKKDKKTDA